jgi:hypothetical protein
VDTNSYYQHWYSTSSWFWWWPEIPADYTVTGHLAITLKSSTSCDLTFSPSITPANTSITIAAKSTDSLLDASNTYPFTSFSTQDAQVKPALSTTPLSGFLNIALPIQIKLAPNPGIAGGTVLPFFDISPGGFFGLTAPAAPCPQTAIYTGNYNAGPPSTGDTLTATFTATQAASNCSYTLNYVGNSYFNSISTITLPTMSFTKHASSVSLPTPATFTAGTQSSSMTITVADADGAAHGTFSTKPSGTVALVVKGNSGTLSCGADYTLDVGCGSMTLNGSGQFAFKITFKAGAAVSNGTFEVTYNGDGNFNAPATTPFVSSGFTVP